MLSLETKKSGKITDVFFFSLEIEDISSILLDRLPHPDHTPSHGINGLGQLIIFPRGQRQEGGEQGHHDEHSEQAQHHTS